MDSTSRHYPLEQQRKLLEELDVFKVQGRDKQGRKILRVIGMFLPARFVNGEALKMYLMEKIFPQLQEGPFTVVYVHTLVDGSRNSLGILTLRSIYEDFPITIKENLETIYFVHPGLRARLFFATFGRFMLTGGLCGKVRYVSRVEQLWKHMRKQEVEMPGFVYDHDDDLEERPLMDYGLEMNYGRLYDDGRPSTFSTRCSMSP